MRAWLVSSFDMLNIADLDVLHQVTNRCPALTVAVLSDRAVEVALGRPPIVPLHERIAILEHVRGVTDVIELDGFVAPEDAGTVFTIREFAAYLPDAVVLEPGARSSSTVLRSALQSSTIEAVA